MASIDALTALARRCLWIAYCWNDHNFHERPEEYAREEAEKLGIKSFEDANRWIATTEDVSDATAAASVLRGRGLPEIKADITALREGLASPVAPAGVPIYEPVQWGPILDALEGFSNDLRDEDYAKLAKLIRQAHELTLSRIDARAVLSAGAPVVPLQDSDSVHLAADDGQAPSAGLTSQPVGGNTAAPTEVDAPKVDLHAAIMNLPCNVPEAYTPGLADDLVYRIGHRDARHAAAELVSASGGTVPTALTVGTPLHCPFCGLHAYVEADFGREWWVQCQSGHSTGILHENAAAALEEWNRRAIRCDGRDGVTGSGASSEAREATPASHGSNETEGAP